MKQRRKKCKPSNLRRNFPKSIPGHQEEGKKKGEGEIHINFPIEMLIYKYTCTQLLFWIIEMWKKNSTFPRVFFFFSPIYPSDAYLTSLLEDLFAHSKHASLQSFATPRHNSFFDIEWVMVVIRGLYSLKAIKTKISIKSYVFFFLWFSGKSAAKFPLAIANQVHTVCPSSAHVSLAFMKFIF